MQHSRFKMHKYVWAWVAVFAAFLGSFPVAMMRVSRTEKFAGQPLNSLTCQGQMLNQKAVVQFADCLQLESMPNTAP